ncbi:MAG: putative aminohydrolase SsnA [Oscillospiraceae bacterium]|nr:putative aminohydrolase SsnA [Oscillospiraceae bacterium]
MKILGNGIVITLDDATGVIQNGAVAYEGGKIVHVGETAAVRAAYPDAAYTDVGGKVIMPGLTNAHTHIYSAMARGMFLNNAKVSHNFNEVLENLWWKVDRALSLEDVRYSAYHTYMESIRFGVTTLFDHHASFGTGAVLGSLDEILAPAQELGVRTSLCFEVSDRNGAELSQQSVEENIRCIKAVQASGNPLLSAMFGIHASFTVNEDTMNRVAEAGHALGAGFHVHTAEGPADAAHCKATYGKPIVKRFYDHGLLGEKSIAVHCIHIDDEEIALLGETGTVVVHNPESNMGNAVGCSNVPKILKAGVLVGLGTDAYTQDMFESLKVANIIHKHVAGDPSATGGEIQDLLLRGNRTIVGRHFGTQTGRLASGCAADLVVVEYTPNTPLDSVNYTGHMTFGFSGAMVSGTIIAGETVYWNRRFTKVDEEKIYAESRRCAKGLWQRLEAE